MPGIEGTSEIVSINNSVAHSVRLELQPHLSPNPCITINLYNLIGGPQCQELRAIQRQCLLLTVNIFFLQCIVPLINGCKSLEKE